MSGRAVTSEQGVQEGTEHAGGAPVLRISVADVLLPTLTTWGTVRKSRIQLQREVFSPRVLSLVISFEGTMVLMR